MGCFQGGGHLGTIRDARLNNNESTEHRHVPRTSYATLFAGKPNWPTHQRRLLSNLPWLQGACHFQRGGMYTRIRHRVRCQVNNEGGCYGRYLNM